MGRWATIDCLRSMTAPQVHDRVAGFSKKYAADWTMWLAVSPEKRVALFGRLLRKWQVGRPLTLRRPKAEAPDSPPFLDDLDAEAEPHVRGLGEVTVREMVKTSMRCSNHLRELWRIFGALPVNVEQKASEVGISKAVLLLTGGRIGPALDLNVRNCILGGQRVAFADEWIAVLQLVAEDILAFEAKCGPLEKAVPAQYSHLECGRLYDMAFGPQ